MGKMNLLRRMKAPKPGAAGKLALQRNFAEAESAALTSHPMPLAALTKFRMKAIA